MEKILPKNRKHRSDYRTSAEAVVSSSFVDGVTHPDTDFDPVERLKSLRATPMPESELVGKPSILHLSMYCYKSFPVRIFHVLSLKDGINSNAVFFKNNFTNNHMPVSEAEIDLLLKVVSETRPDAITLSVLAPYVVETRRAVAAIRTVSDAPIIIGGKYSTIAPHEALEFADYACKGEGEILLLRVHQRLREGRNLQNIRGLWYKDDAGQVVDMGQEELYQDLDDIPYAAIGEMQMHFIEKDELSSEDPELYDDEMLVMAGRGCVYLCSFCVNSLLIPMNRGNGRFVRIRSPENVIEELRYRLQRCKEPNLITFNDEVFGVFDDWVEKFSFQYKRDIDIPFDCELVPSLIKRDNVKLLAEAGMVSMHFGVQTGQDEIRKTVMHRPGTNDDLRAKAELMHEIGVEPQYDFILGNPFDTAETLSEALGLLLSFGIPIRLNTYKMQYFPHYPFTNMALEAGHITPDDVSDEGIARATMYEWAFRPKFPAFDRRDYIENCIYLLPWSSTIIRATLKLLQRRHIPILGLFATIMANVRYYQGFEGVAGLVWIRRLFIALSFIVRGDLSSLREKIGQVLTRDKYKQPRTGRLS